MKHLHSQIREIQLTFFDFTVSSPDELKLSDGKLGVLSDSNGLTVIDAQLLF